METKRRKLSKSDRISIYNKTNGHCAYCGCELEYKDMQVDHISPLHRGGIDSIDNMYPACRSCNHYKSTYTIDEFREQIGTWLDRLTRDSVTYKNAVRYGLVIPNPKPIVFYFEEIAGGGE